MSRATSLKALVGNLRFVITWKTWAVLVVFGAGAADRRDLVPCRRHASNRTHGRAHVRAHPPSPSRHRRVGHFHVRPRPPLHDLALHPTAGPDAGGGPDLFGLSLCAGAGGLDLGLALAEPGYRAVGYVERDAFAAAVLVARMEDQTLDQAPVWDDLAGFDGRPWRGAVDLVSAGYPCQPFSVAGTVQGRGRSAPPLAARRPGHLRMRTSLGVPRERPQSSQPRLSRGQGRAGRPGLRGYGRIVHGG